LHYGEKWWRRGPPWRAWRELRRERELRQLIRELADDPSTGFDGETIDEFAEYAELEWLDEIAAHLALQPAPRSLAAAILATDPPSGDDEEPDAIATDEAGRGGANKLP
jgi:hypothetical protein